MIGISSCLLGEKVRFDGAHKRHSYITGTLADYFDFQPICPEVAIGLGIPRTPIHLQEMQAETRCVDIKNTKLDYTDQLRTFADQQSSVHAQLCGYILKKDSPSCGMERVKVHSHLMPVRKGIGIYAQQMMQNHPYLPVEEEGRLGDSGLRENFIQRVYVLHRWKNMISSGLTQANLTEFHARHKLILMSRGDYQQLGRLLAEAGSQDLKKTADCYIKEMMQQLKSLATRNKQVNVLQHIQGYLKKQLNKEDKTELCEIIQQYHSGLIPLIVPITLLKHHFRKCPNSYIINSYYMSPYPHELQLINQI